MATPVVKSTNGFGTPVTVVASGGLPVDIATNGFGTPIIEVASGGIPITYAQGGGGGGFTDPNLFYFSTNRLRTPVAVQSVATAAFQVHRTYLGTAPFETKRHVAAWPMHYTDTTNKENPTLPSVMTVEGWSIGFGPTADPIAASTTWVAGKFGGNDGVVWDPASNPVGGWTDILDQIVPAGYHRWVAIAFNVPSGGNYVRSVRYAPSQSLEGALGNTSASQKAKLTDKSAITVGASQASGYAPTYFLSTGHDGRPAFLFPTNDSIGFGEVETGYSQDTPAWGYLGRGFEDAASSKKMFGGNMCVPGCGPHAWLTAGRNGEFTAGFTTVKKKLDLLAGAPNVPFTHILHEGGTNSAGITGWSTNFKGKMEEFIAQCLNVEWPGVPVFQCTMVPKASTVDGWQTAAGQTALSGFEAGGQLALFNAALLAGTVLGVTGYVDAASLMTEAGTTGKWKVDPFTTTLAADYTASSTTIVLTDNPGKDACIVLDPDASGAAGAGQVVRTVTGSGPYTCTLINGFSYGKSTGVKVGAAGTIDGTHPVKSLHVAGAPAVVAMKNRVYA